MKNKFFTHRFLPILSVFLFTIFVFFTNVKATDVTFDDLTFTIPDNVEKYLLGNYESGGYLLLVPNSETSVFKITGDTGTVIGINCYTDTTYSTLCPFDSYYLPSGTNFNSAYLTKNVTDNRTFKKSSAFYYSDFDIYNFDNSIFFAKNNTISYSIELSTNYETNGPITAYSNYFDYSDVGKYECYISTDASNWTLMNIETFNDTVNNIVKFRFNYKIFENGSYYFKFLNTETNEDYYLSYNITNIIKNSTNSGFTISGIPQPFCTYERVNDEFIIKTQNFTVSDMQKFRCLYTKNPTSDFSSWSEMSMGSYNNSLTGETEYYFFFTVPKDSEDCIFYFVFYDYNLQEYGSPSSLNCFFDKMNEYADSLSPVVSEKNNKFYELLNYFKERFGFLTYPFEFLIDFFNRILNINYSEPVIHIPELREPFGNNKIFNGIDFNFNSLINNSTFSYLYNIYLIAVDFIIVVLFIFLCKKVIEEVFTNG